MPNAVLQKFKIDAFFNARCGDACAEVVERWRILLPVFDPEKSWVKIGLDGVARPTSQNKICGSLRAAAAARNEMVNRCAAQGNEQPAIKTAALERMINLIALGH